MKFITVLLIVLVSLVSAKKVLVFDENSGIQWVDQDANTGKKFEVPEIKQKKKVVVIEEGPLRVPDHVKTQPLTAAMMRETGQKFYLNGDYAEAKKYFDRAYEMEKDPLDMFWQGAILRKQDRIPEMVKIFKYILEKNPGHEAADDALFYLAVEDQKKGDYESALLKYRDVIERYPEGISIVGRFLFRDEARKQLRAIQADISSRLSLLGIVDGPLAELLRNFQKENDLPVTGSADSLTVNTLIALSDGIEQKMKSGISDKQGIGSFRRVILGAIALLLAVNILWTTRIMKTTTDEGVRLKIFARDIVK
ncbi:MAG: tetratricopeptide repeat protein [Fibrobacteres bacterium]|nr:tetratricopeptide repeat protein [Fibrobacterota bacterium]